MCADEELQQQQTLRAIKIGCAAWLPVSSAFLFCFCLWLIKRYCLYSELVFLSQLLLLCSDISQLCSEVCFNNLPWILQLNHDLPSYLCYLSIETPCIPARLFSCHLLSHNLMYTGILFHLSHQVTCITILCLHICLSSDFLWFLCNIELEKR